MVLATAKIGDFDRFWNTFSTKGAEKRKQHGCRGRTSFGIQMRATGFGRSSTGTRRAGKLHLDPEVPAIFQEAGFTQGPPKSAEFLRQHDA